MSDQDEIEQERQRCREATNDPSHPWHDGVSLFRGLHDTADEKTRDFMRKIAPYMFEARPDEDAR